MYYHILFSYDKYADKKINIYFKKQTMSFLANKLKLEVKSTNKSRLARFSSIQKDANIHIIPNDSSNFFGIIGASAKTDTDNLNTYISLFTNNINTKVASFDANSVNFGNDTLLKGNILVLGTVYTLASDILTEENTFILNNYGASASAGLNSISKISQQNVISSSQNLSNILIDYNIEQFQNLKNSLNLNTISTHYNNNFTPNDFNNKFSTKSLDDLNQGTSNRFIIDNQYDPSTPENPFIVTGYVNSSNIFTNNIYAKNIYANIFYGDGANIVNIDTNNYNTNNIIELNGASNLYLTLGRINTIASASNVPTSNYIHDLYSYFDEFINAEDTNSSNLIFVISSNLYDEFYIYKDIFINYLYDNSNIILYNIKNLFENLSNITSNKDYVLNALHDDMFLLSSNTFNLFDENVSNHLFTSFSNTNNDVYLTSNTIYNSIQYIFDDLSINSQNINTTMSNIILNSNINISNLISFIYDTFQQDLSLSNYYIQDHLNNVSQDITNNINDILIPIMEEYLANQSNTTIFTTDQTFNNLYTYLLKSSNNINQYDDTSFFNTSNYILSVTNYIDILSNSLDNTSSNDIINLNLTANILYQSLYSLSNLTFQEILYNLYLTSNELLEKFNLNLINQSSTKDTILTSLSQTLDNAVSNISSTNIPETINNIYYTYNRFLSSLTNKSLDNIHITQGSNQVIINNIYNSNLFIIGDLTVNNISVFGNNATFNTSVYDTERIEIKNFSNMPAVKLNNYNSSTANILEISNANDNVFILQNDAKVGILKPPTSTLDVAGTIKANTFKGLGTQLFNINLSSLSSAHIKEGTSNLYFKSTRISPLLSYSNVDVSNLVSSSSNSLIINANLLDKNNSNLILNISNILIKSTYNLNSNYTFATSNNIFQYIDYTRLNQSNYITTTSNSIISYSSNLMFTLNQSNYVKNVSNYIIATINYSNTLFSNSLLTQSNIDASISKDSIINQSNYVFNFSNIIATRINTIISNHSNLINNLSNLFIYDMSNYVYTTSNIFLTMKSSAVSNSNLIDQYSNEIINFTNSQYFNITLAYNPGDIVTYSSTFDYNIVNMNFKDKKIMNNINSDYYRITSNTSNFTSIFPIIDTFTTFIDRQNYLISNEYAFRSTSNVYMFLNNQYDIKKLLRSINEKIFGIHFVINILAGSQTTPIYAICNTNKIFINITVKYGLLFIQIGNGLNGSILSFYSTAPIFIKTWYIIDIVCDTTNNLASIQLYINGIQQNVYLHNSMNPIDVNLIAQGAFTSNLIYTAGENTTMFIGSYNNYDKIDYDYRPYTLSATFTNTYYSSNPYMTNTIAPIIRSSAYDYTSFSNLIFSSYYASNFDYQFSSNINSLQLANNDFAVNIDNTRLIIGDRDVNNLNFVFTEVEANIKLITGYYHFFLDLQNEVTADLLIGKQTDKSFDDYINVANYYNSNLLNNPSATLNHTSNLVLSNPLFISDGYYRFYLRMLRIIQNRHNRYLISSYYYTSTSNGYCYYINNSNLFLTYTSKSNIDNIGYSSSNTVNSLLYINNTIIPSTSNLFKYSYTYNGVFSRGYNANGVLGINNNTTTFSTTTFQNVLGINGGTPINGIQNVYAYGSSSFFLKNSDGSVYGCGYNANGILGIGNTTMFYSSLQQVLGENGIGVITNVSNICIGKDTSYFVMKSGKVYVCGLNVNGNHARGPTASSTNTLQLVKGTDGTSDLTNIKKVSHTTDHVLFMSINGSLYGAGQNRWGQLGIGTTNSSGEYTLKGPITVTAGAIVKDIGAGNNFSFTLLDNGTVFSCGYDEQTGRNLSSGVAITTFQQVTGMSGGPTLQMAVSANHAIFLQNDTYMFGTGFNNNGQLANGSTSTVVQRNTTNLKINSTTNISGIKSIYAYENATILVKTDNTVWCSGDSSSGELTGTAIASQAYLINVTTLNNSISIAKGTDHLVAVINSTPTVDVSNYNYSISHSNISSNNFFAGITSNNILIQDFRIYSSNTVSDITNNISNILIYGNNNPDIITTKNVIIKPVRWTDSVSYYSNYYSYFSRYITYNDTGNIGVGIGKSSTPQASLDIYTDDPTIYSIKTNNPIWVQSGLVASSDMRIKNNIRDIYDKDALKQILAIQPKTYNYIDTDKRTDKLVYGFIAQQIKNVIPNAVSMQTEAIPNIQSHAILQNNLLYLLNNINTQISLNSIIIIEYNTVKYYEYVVEVYNNSIFKIENKANLPNGTLYVYGMIVNDFHNLDKNYIYTLSVCATQDMKNEQDIITDITSNFTVKLNTSCNDNSNAYYFASNVEKILGLANIDASDMNELLELKDTLYSDITNINSSFSQYNSDLSLVELDNNLDVLSLNNSNILSSFDELTSLSKSYITSANNLDNNVNNINNILEKNNLF
jgi:alpha-tubulin suppressor-like RCC1 family protein